MCRNGLRKETFDILEPQNSWSLDEEEFDIKYVLRKHLHERIIRRKTT